MHDRGSSIINKKSKIKNLVINKAKEFRIFFRYLSVAILGLILIDIGLLSLLVYGFGVYSTIAAGISFGVMIIHNFLWHKYWTFKDSNHDFAEQSTKFLLLAMVDWALNLGLMHLFAQSLAFQLIFAKVLTSTIVFVWSFTANRIWTFGKAAANIKE
ncbi:GtrA family protein [Patescibacteria group bacterium]|nr:GtrA family protein [Patescibacteria group bacterium]